jgi:hypothetical protein
LPHLDDAKTLLVPISLVLVVLVIESRVPRDPRLSPLLLDLTDRRCLILGRLSHCFEGV